MADFRFVRLTMMSARLPILALVLAAYEGPFVEDGRHGVGTCRSRDGRWGKCEFRKEKFVGWRK